MNKNFEVIRDYNTGLSFNQCRLPMFSGPVENPIEAIKSVAEKTCPGMNIEIVEFDRLTRGQVKLENGHVWLFQVCNSVWC